MKKPLRVSAIILLFFNGISGLLMIIAGSLLIRIEEKAI